MGVLNRNRKKDYVIHRRFMATDRHRNQPRRCRSRIQKTWWGRAAAFHRLMKAIEVANEGKETPKVVKLIIV